MTKTAGYIIPKGWTAMLIVPDIHMKEEVYNDPYEFNPSRWEVIKFNNVIIF